jgi:hypothetical protein
VLIRLSAIALATAGGSIFIFSSFSSSLHGDSFYLFSAFSAISAVKWRVLIRSSKKSLLVSIGALLCAFWFILYDFGFIFALLRMRF